jgi:hypothetical protein
MALTNYHISLRDEFINHLSSLSKGKTETSKFLLQLMINEFKEYLNNNVIINSLNKLTKQTKDLPPEIQNQFFKDLFTVLIKNQQWFDSFSIKKDFKSKVSIDSEIQSDIIQPLLEAYYSLRSSNSFKYIMELTFYKDEVLINGLTQEQVSLVQFIRELYFFTGVSAVRGKKYEEMPKLMSKGFSRLLSKDCSFLDTDLFIHPLFNNTLTIVNDAKISNDEEKFVSFCNYELVQLFSKFGLKKNNKIPQTLMDQKFGDNSPLRGIESSKTFIKNKTRKKRTLIPTEVLQRAIKKIRSKYKQ